MLIKHAGSTSADFVRRFKLDDPAKSVVNLGSKDKRPVRHCVNVDKIDGPGVDVVADIQNLPVDWCNIFDAVICVATLQYCESPQRALDEMRRILRPGGCLFIDAPFVQPYCKDTPDLWRFTADCLTMLARNTGFVDIEVGPSITSGSAWVMQAEHMFGNWFRGGGRIAAPLLAWAKNITTPQENHTAGAHYLIARKPARG